MRSLSNTHTHTEELSKTKFVPTQHNLKLSCVLLMFYVSNDNVFKVECSATARRIHSISIVVENKHFILQHCVNDNTKDETRKINISKHKISKLSMWVSFQMALLFKEPMRWLGCRMERVLAIQHLSTYLWHTGSTSSHWRGRWGGRSSWCCHDCCRSWYGGWGWRCLPPRSCPLCDRPLDSGYSASDGLCANQRRGEPYVALIFFFISLISDSFMGRAVLQQLSIPRLTTSKRAEKPLPLLALCKSLSKQQVEQMCWGQQNPPPGLLVVPRSFRTQSSW